MAVRSILVLLAVVAVVLPGRAVGVGLGDIHLSSLLNQPLRADIELLNVQDLEASQLRASLAPPDDFAEAGIQWHRSLSDLRLAPDLVDADRPLLRLTSSRPIREPYLDFLVRLEWPGGQLVRAYTLLLDLPAHSFSAQSALLDSGPVTFDTPARPSPAGPGVRPLRAPEPVPISADTTTYEVSEGDTLWNVASRIRPEDMSVQQAMMALYQLNPDAFIAGDMNRLRRGHILRLPERAEVEAVDPVAARSRVWRESGTSLSAIAVADGPAVSDAAESPADESATPQAAGALERSASEQGDAEIPASGEWVLEEGSGNKIGLVGFGGLTATAVPEVDRVVLLEAEIAVVLQENKALRERIAGLEEQVTALAQGLERPDSERVITAAAGPQLPAEKSVVPRAVMAVIALAVLLLLWLLRRARTRRLADEDVQSEPDYLAPPPLLVPLVAPSAATNDAPLTETAGSRGWHEPSSVAAVVPAEVAPAEWESAAADLLEADQLDLTISDDFAAIMDESHLLAERLPDEPGLDEERPLTAGEMGGLLDPLQTQLDLACVYLEMGEADSARDILEGIVQAGNAEQQAQARDLLRTMG